MTVAPTEKKISKVSRKINDILNKKETNIREIASLAGLLNDVSKAVDYGLGHNKNLEIDKIKALKTVGKIQFEGWMCISPESRIGLGWWLWNIPSRVRKIRISSPAHILTTDASIDGWGRFGKGTSQEAGGALQKKLST